MNIQLYLRQLLIWLLILAPSAIGNSNRTKPERGFDDPELAQVFAQVVANITIPVVNTTTLVSPWPTNDYSQSRLPVGAIAGVIAGGIVGGFVLLITVWFILRRRQYLMTLPKLHEMAPTETQELQECALYELHDPSNVHELPSLPIELYGSVPEGKQKTELDCGP